MSPAPGYPPARKTGPVRLPAWAVRDVALELECPRCHQGDRKPCVYTTAPTGSGRQLGEQTGQLHWERIEAARRKIGRGRAAREIMEALRPDRREVVRKAVNSRWQVIDGRREFRPVQRSALDAAAALSEFDRREYVQLRDWLAEYGEILTELR